MPQIACKSHARRDLNSLARRFSLYSVLYSCFPPGSQFGALHRKALHSALLFLFLLVSPHSSLQAQELTTRGSCTEVEAHQFDFWVGEWDVLNRQRNPSTPDNPAFYPTGTAQMRVYPVLDGCLLIEHWEGKLNWGEVEGFSARAYNPASKTWTILLNWLSPPAFTPGFSLLEGDFHHNRGEFFAEAIAANGQARKSRFTFSDLLTGFYRWDSAFSLDGGLSWQVTWIMEGTRRPASHPALFLGPWRSGEPTRCPSEEARALDTWKGHWTGRQIYPETSEPVTATLENHLILKGCANMEFLHVQSKVSSWKGFQIRSWESASKSWIQYTLNNQTRVFQKSQGKLLQSQLTLEREEPAEEQQFREHWHRVSEEELHWMEESSNDGGETWKLLKKFHFTR